VESGGTVGGTGNAGGGVVVNNGGTLAPGNLGVGTLEATLRIGGVTANSFIGIDDGGAYAWELATAGPSSTVPGGSTTAPGTQHDFIQVTGNIVFGDAATDTMVVRPINLAGSGFDPLQPYSWRLGSATQAVGITGTVTVDASNFGNLQGGSFSVSAVGGNLYLNFTPIPEPAGLLALAGVAAVGAAWRRRRT
jgi:PEP-CTERM motif